MLVRAKRVVEAANPTEYEYMEGSLPIEWDGESIVQASQSQIITVTVAAESRRRPGR